MSVTVEWLLEQDKKNSFTLLAGQGGVGNEIKSVNIMDNPDTLAWLTENELVLTTGYVLKEDIWLRNNIISELKKKGCAGLGFVLKRYIDDLPVEMLRQANELNFPIISISYNLSLAEVIGMVYERNYQEQMGETERFNAAYQRIAQSVVYHQSISEMLGEIVKTLDFPCLLVDAELNLVEYALPEAADEALLQMFHLSRGSSPFDSRSTRELRTALPHEDRNMAIVRLSPGKGRGCELVVFPVRELRTVIGYVCIPQTEKKLNSMDYRFIDLLLPMFSISMMHDMMLSRFQINNKNTFIKLITSENAISEKELETQCDLYGFDYSLLRVCVVIRLKESNYNNIRSKYSLSDMVYEIISKELRKNHPNSFKLSFQDNIIIFLFYPSNTPVLEAIRDAKEQAGELSRSIGEENIGFETGISKAHSGAMSISTDLHQAFEAIRIGSSVHKDRSVFSYTEDQPYHILLNSLSYADVSEIYGESLGRLAEIDAESKQSLEATLLTYLDCNLSISQAAKKLYLHRNTMSYRIDHIQEILDVDLSDFSVLNRLYIAALVKRLLDSGLFQ